MPKIVEKEKFYTCRNDRAFKEIFLKEQNRDLLKKLLEDALGVEIFNIEEQNIERNTGNLKVRRKNLDVFLCTDKGKIDIEMNACKKNYLHARNMAYQCDNYSHYTLVGEEYSENIQIIQINFTYEMGISDKKIVRKYYIQDEEKEKYVKNFIILEYNMDRIMEFWYSKNEREIEKYKYFIMLDLGLEDLEKLSKRDRWVEKYKMDVEIINRDANFRVYMTEEEDQRKCHNTELSYARSEGARENSIEIAKKMLAKGKSIEEIEEFTELSSEKIKNLKNNFGV